MSKKKRNPVKLRVDVAAKAQAKLEVRANVPEKSAGRLVDALTDIIRPFTERRGLRADEIRLQREDVLIQIAQKAKERARIEKVVVEEVPNKFMVSFLEKASSEDVRSDLIDRWADLLVSASENYNSSFVRYSSVLSEIGPEEVNVLRRLVASNRNELQINHLEDAPLIFSAHHLSGQVHSLIRSKLEFDAMVSVICQKIELPGGLVLHCYLFRGDDFLEVEHPEFSERDRASLSILESLSVVARATAVASYKGRELNLSGVYLTEFGIGFYLACDRDAKRRFDEINSVHSDSLRGKPDPD